VYRFHHDVLFRAIPDVRVELLDGPYLSVDRGGVAVLLRIRGTMTGSLDPPGFAPTDGPLDFRTAEFSSLVGGRLARHTVMLDMLGLARRIAAVPTAGSPADCMGVRLQQLAARLERRRRDSPR
jgi:hypothetical protein